MYKLGLEKAEESEIKLPTFIVSEKAKGFQKRKKKSTCASLTRLKPLTLCITTNCGKFLKSNTRPPYLSPEKPVCRSRSKQLELDMEQLTGSKLGKEYDKAVYCHPVYLTYVWSTSSGNVGLNKSQVGIKISRRNIKSLRYVDDTTLMAESEMELKRLWMRVKQESETAGLKLNIQKTKIMASGPITSWQIHGETM